MSNENGQTGAPAVVHQFEGDDFITQLVPAYALQHLDTLREYRDKLQNFTARLDQPPPLDSLDKTPDGNAQTVVISHIEMTLDEFFFGLWETYDFKWSVIANEVVGSIILEIVHPVSGEKIRRTGAAAIQIMVDQTPEEYQYNKNDPKAVQMEKKRQRNMWANNPENKKPAALDMGFPKLKAECVKNAAQSLGKLFGRDLNRKIADTFKPIQKRKAASATAATEDLLKSKQ